MDELLAKICVNCEHSSSLSSLGEDACLCFKKGKRIVRKDGSCRDFTTDLLKFIPSKKPVLTLDAPDLENL